MLPKQFARVLAILTLVLVSLVSTDSHAAVGRTPGSEGVSPTGEAQYTIPIKVPPGANGLEPELAFVYGHRNSEGLMGIGWGLAGLSQISRCGKNVARNGEVEGVQLTTDDRFCLDGNQLQLKTGTHGSSGSTYRTEIDLMARVTAFGTAGNGPAWFKVEAKDGLIYEYGNTADSRIESLATGFQSTARTWALSKIYDRSGNEMHFNYVEDGSPYGDYRISSIEYLINLSAGRSSPGYRIDFSYVNQPTLDTDSGFGAGGDVEDVKRLSSIRIESLHAPVSTVRSYDIKYESSLSSTNRSRIEWIRECSHYGSGGVFTDCLQETIFEYSNGTVGINTGISMGISLPGGVTPRSMDINGDGRSDLVYPSAASGGYWAYRLGTSSGTYGSQVTTDISSAGHEDASVMDYNADGYDDLLLPYSGSNWWVIQGQRSGQYLLQDPLDTGSQNQNGDMAYTADVNGDGYDDIFYGLAGAVYLQLRQPAGGFGSTILVMSNYLTPRLRYDFKKSGRFKFDVNGDGAEDILIFTGCPHDCGGHDWWIWSYKDGGVILQGSASTLPNDRALPLDINGDGYSDLVTKGVPLGSNLRYRFSTGKGLGPFLTIPGTGGLDPEDMVRIDWNNDGQDDVLYPNATTGNWSLIVSDGYGLAAPTDTGIATSASGGYWVDIDGDGLEDVMTLSGNVTVHRRSGVMADLMESATDGNGHVIEFEYAPITDPSVYTNQTNAAHPERDFQEPVYVVKTIERSTGNGDTYTVDYSYTGAKFNTQGRGLGGFKKRTIVDNRTGNKVIEKYKTEFPYRGRLAETTTFLSDDTLIQDINYVWWNKTGNTGYETYYYPYLRESIEKNFEAGGTYNGLQINEIKTTNTVDSYGTVTKTIVETTESSTANGAQPGVLYRQKIEKTNIVNTESQWCLGQVGTIEQTNSHTSTFGAAITRTTDLEWDLASFCRIDKSIVEPSSPEYRVETSFGYDVFGNVDSTSVSGIGMATRMSTIGWSVDGQRPVWVTNALSQTTTNIWNYDTGDLKMVTDPNGIVTEYEYDGFGRRTRLTRPDGTYVTYDIAACSASNNWCGTSFNKVRTEYKATTKDFIGTVVREDYTYLDELDRPIQSESQSLSGAMTMRRLEYDAFGRVAKRYMPTFGSSPTANHHEAFHYDTVGRVWKITSPRNSTDSTLVETLVYYEGLTTRVTDGNGNNSKKITDAVGQLYQSYDNASHYQQFEYDAYGSVRRTIDSEYSGDPLMEATYGYGIAAYRETMDDMDLGDGWTFSPNALGELEAYTDAKSQSFSATFDLLGRPKTRTEPEGTTTWTWGTSATMNNIGRLQSISSPSFSESYLYDSHGRLSKKTTVTDTTYEFDYAYDAATGRLGSITYPEATNNFRLQVNHLYQYGILYQLKRDDNSKVYWTANTEDAFGNVIDADLGNGVKVVRGFDAVTGRIDYAQAGLGGGTALQDFEYAWDDVGNLISREDVNGSLEEKFYYDNMNRLDSSELNSTTNLDVDYDPDGNIDFKSDVGAGSWQYHTSKKHAVISAGSKTYQYDSNGNMNERDGDDITWTSYNKPSQIEEGNKTYEYAYDAYRKRWKQVYDNGTDSETTFYVGGLYEKNVHSGDTEHRHYIVANGEAVALYIERENSYNNLQYFVRDHQGSISAILTASATAKVYENFNAFGERRNPQTWSGAPPQSDLNKIDDLTDRGYTDQLNLESSSLVHMNGRVMDAEIGRFLSPDPYVWEPGNTQAFNRYSYVYNNPMTYTDPSGYVPIVPLLPEACLSFCKSVVLTVLDFVGGLFGGSPKPKPNWCAIGGPGGCYGDVDVTQYQFQADTQRLPNSSNNIGRAGMPPPTGFELGRFENVKRLGKDVLEEVAYEFVVAPIIDLAEGRILSAACKVAKVCSAGGKLIAAGKKLFGRWRGQVPKQTVDTPVIGRQFDTQVARDWPGHRILDDPNWTLKKNDEWIQDIVKRREKVYTGSPQNRPNVWDSVNNRETVYGRELRQLQEAGYTWDGDYLIPPSP